MDGTDIERKKERKKEGGRERKKERKKKERKKKERKREREREREGKAYYSPVVIQAFWKNSGKSRFLPKLKQKNRPF